MPLNVSLEPYNGSRSQNSHNNIKRMLSVVYFHCKTIRNIANITANFEKSRSKISHFRPSKIRKKSCEILEGLIRNVNDVSTCQEGGHSGPVNSVQWHPEDSVLYSGSDDTHIAEWDLQTGKVRWWVCAVMCWMFGKYGFPHTLFNTVKLFVNYKHDIFCV